MMNSVLVLSPMLLVALLLTLLVVFALLWPLRGRNVNAGHSVRQLSAQVYRDRLDELNADLSTGRLEAETYAQLKLELDRGVLADTTADARIPVAHHASVKPLAFVLLVSVPVLTLALYLGYFLNSQVAPDLKNQALLAPSIDAILAGKEPEAAAKDASLQDFMRALQRRVQAEPNNADAWMTLGLGFLQAKDYEPAKVALARAAELRPEDIQVVMTYVQATIMTQNGAMDPVARGMLGRILREQPDHQGALLMLGMGTLRAGEREQALAVLTQLQMLRAAEVATNNGQRDSEADQRIERLILEAQQGPQVAAAGIQVEVDLDPELARQLPAEAALFIFARTPSGPPMPVAVLKRPIAQFPLRVTLTNADSLQPTRLLSDQKELVLQAKISMTGNATPAADDWQAVPVPVTEANTGMVRLRITKTR